ncbi:hypothetical protein D9M71_561100 [compost metagenome]
MIVTSIAPVQGNAIGGADQGGVGLEEQAEGFDGPFQAGELDVVKPVVQARVLHVLFHMQPVVRRRCHDLAGGGDKAMQADFLQRVAGGLGAEPGCREAQLVELRNQRVTGLVRPGGRGQGFECRSDIENQIAFDQAQSIMIEATDVHRNVLLWLAQASASCR